MRTQVCISIDLEFAIAGAFTWPDRHKPVGTPAIEAMYKGQSQGIGYLERCFEETGVAATFFVEALQTHYFGHQEMGQHCQRLAAQGHDLQLHLHPCWLRFQDPDWAARTDSVPSDSLVGRPIEESRDIIRSGVQIFRDWQLAAPFALRTGGLTIARDIYKALSGSGIDMGSNIGAAINPSVDADLHIRGGRAIIEGITEVPVTCYRDLGLGSRSHSRILTITGTSWAEMRSLLKQARRQRIETIMVLTHAHEFFKHRWLEYSDFRPNKINQTRLRKLCEFVTGNPEEFEFVTFASAREHWLGSREPEPDLSVSPVKMLGRLAQNSFNSRGDYK